MIIPIKAGAEALDRTDDLAQAWLYATDMNADVITSVTADLGYSTFMKQAVDYAWNHGVLMTESSNDFDSIDHQGGMFHSHVIPGNGMVANTHGIPTSGPGALLQNANTRTYNQRSGLTSWGTHNIFSGSTEGGSTSESTPTVAGVMALVRAYGKEAASPRPADGEAPLSADEVIQVIRANCGRHRRRPQRGRRLARQDRLGHAVRLRAPQRLQGDAGDRQRRHPARGLVQLARLVLAPRPDQGVARSRSRATPRRRAPPAAAASSSSPPGPSLPTTRTTPRGRRPTPAPAPPR